MKKIILLIMLCLAVPADAGVYKKKIKSKVKYALKQTKGKLRTIKHKQINKRKKRNLTKKTKKRIIAAHKYLAANAPHVLEGKQKKGYEVRVLLEKLSKPDKNKTWTLKLESKKGFIVQQSEKHSKKILIRNNSIYLSVDNNNLFIKTATTSPRKINGNSIIFSPLSNYSVLNGTPYEGYIYIYPRKNKAPCVINKINLDDYIYSVLRSEIYQSWPDEMQKVQAVTSRTYAMHHIFNSREKNKIYDIRSTGAHQNYKGYHPYTHLRKAVQETENLILTHNKKPALTMFDICCGGSTPANIKGLNFDKAPYLARQQSCNYCKNYNLYRWNKEINLNEFMNNLKSHKKLSNYISHIGKLQEIKIAEKDKGGIVHKLRIKGSKRSIICSGRTLIESVGDKIKSLSFNLKEIKKNNSSKNLLFTGKGFGHQIGLCQRGAYTLVKKGWDFKEILSFYFPKTKFAQINRIKG
ncbi:SpoIID/LytB domain-containing protein [Candidatus Babeliales bacterium]|nr:SpoIID/LytB domain-containing protein [Candidatus Babeliales bacterium]